jgi:chemotaxis family two-component system sensor kinase Cph1
LNAVLAEVLQTLRILLDERGVQIRVPTPLPTLKCDHVRIGEVFRNLITNAIKYNDKTEKWIEIDWHTDAGLRATTSVGPDSSTRPRPIVFSVRDNGIGVPQRHIESIFRIFKRLHGRDKFGGGTGIGLTIVKKIIERHGGRIWVDSTLGEGSTFSFVLSDEDSDNGRSASDPGDRG